MLTEEQIQEIERTLNIKRQNRPDGLCVFGLYEQEKGCGRPAVNWLPSTVMDCDGGTPELLNICKYHSDAFGLEE